MSILALAARHHEVGVANLERLSARPNAVRRAVLAACPEVRGVVVLATCNRFELYLDAAPSDRSLDVHDADIKRPGIELSGVVRVVARELGLPAALVSTTLVRVEDPARHLCEVAVGLDSMVLGEREIAGQVRRAIASARAAGTSTGALDRLFAAASRVARRVARNTGLGAFGRSVVDVALDVAGAAPGTRCVLVGTGSYAGAVVAALARRGVDKVEVFSATGRAAKFAAPRGLDVVAPDGLAAAIADAGIVVTCSGGPGFVVRPEHLAVTLAVDSAGRSAHSAGPADADGAVRAEGPPPAPRSAYADSSTDAAELAPVAGRGRSRRTLAVVDLALCRDVDPAVGELPNVRLISLRELAALDDGPAAAGVARAREIVAAAVVDLAAAERSLAWGRDLATVRRRALDGHSPEGRRRVHAALHPGSVAAHAAARAGDRPGFDRALLLIASAPMG